MLSREATNTNFIVFGLTRSGLKPTIDRTRDKHANNFTTDAVYKMYICRKVQPFYVKVNNHLLDLQSADQHY
jgi:hypothetical protein